MQAFLAAHDAFVAWLEGLDASPSADEIDRALWGLALKAADRGMTETHWTFVVDGLVAYVNRRAPGNLALPTPIQRPHPPILIGGNSQRAVRRAVELGTGWLPVHTDASVSRRRGTASVTTPADIRAKAAYAAEHAAAVGRLECRSKFLDDRLCRPRAQHNEFHSPNDTPAIATATRPSRGARRRRRAMNARAGCPPRSRGVTHIGQGCQQRSLLPAGGPPPDAKAPSRELEGAFGRFLFVYANCSS